MAGVAHGCAEPKAHLEKYTEFLLQSCRLSPFASENDCVDSAPTQTYSTLIEQLNSLQLAYLHLIEPRVHYNFDVETVDTHYRELRALRDLFNGPVIAAGELYAGKHALLLR